MVSALAFRTTAAGERQDKAPGTISYETFCALPDVQEKRAAFVAATPENRAKLVRTQIERWRALHRSRLSSEQLALLAEILSKRP
jgi:hypothetical protein